MGKYGNSFFTREENVIGILNGTATMTWLGTVGQCDYLMQFQCNLFNFIQSISSHLLYFQNMVKLGVGLLVYIIELE